jgi:DNA-directed RNA polymerase specialized sigma24 family protein
MELNRALEHMEFHHRGADGWITLARKAGGKYIQRHYRYEEMREQLQEWLGEDVYFSQNTFHKPQRRIENIRQLRSLYVDVDQYLLNYSPEWVIGKMELELFGQKVPEPNIIIHSGRGFVIIWLHDPVPYMALPLWQAIEKHFSDQFELLGGDTRATDAARVFRLAGTVNSKSGEEVTVQYRHDYRYTLRQLQQDYLPEIPTDPRKKNKGKPSKAVHLFNTYSLHYARLQDLVKLVELRKYDVKGHRETICFLYRYWSCCFLQDEDEALKQTLELNSEFLDPLPEREVIQATRSAEKAWRAKNDAEANRIAKEKGYPGAGYNISNRKLIEWLGITEEEQKHLSSIIGRREKYDRNNERRAKARREAGKLSRQEYLNQAEKRRVEAQRMREAGFKYKDIAEKLGITVDAVKTMFRKKV